MKFSPIASNPRRAPPLGTSQDLNRFAHRFVLSAAFLCGPVLAPGLDGKLLDLEQDKTIFLLTLSEYPEC